MKTITLEIELTYDDEAMHSGDGSPEDKEWFFEDVLRSSLTLRENSEVGDDIGEVCVVSITDDVYE